MPLFEVLSSCESGIGDSARLYPMYKKWVSSDDGMTRWREIVSNIRSKGSHQ